MAPWTMGAMGPNQARTQLENSTSLLSEEFTGTEDEKSTLIDEQPTFFIILLLLLYYIIIIIIIIIIIKYTAY